MDQANYLIADSFAEKEQLLQMVHANLFTGSLYVLFSKVMSQEVRFF